MQSYISPLVVNAIMEDRRRAASGRVQQPLRGARPPGGRFRRTTASAVVRVARRIDADAARRAMAA